jgi:hypothetical protein
MMKRITNSLLTVFFALAIIATGAARPARAAGHAIEVERPILAAEEGLLLGNGDLSVSVYQTADKIIWRFGKGDVWDRRLDRSDDAKPPHIREVAHGIEVEGWKCPPYGGPVEATRGTKDAKRMREICQSCPPSYVKRPYPCPKPVGELALHLPPDLAGLTVHQRLVIEDAKLLIECRWPSGVKIKLESFVPPRPNVLVVRWKVENWNAQTRMGSKPPVWFSLYRWADPSIQSFAAKFFSDCGHDGFNALTSPKITPLPEPTVKREGDSWAIEQPFPADPTFPNGFRYLLAPFAPDVRLQPVNMAAAHEARIWMFPADRAMEGKLAVAVATTSDVGGPTEEIKRIAGRLGQHPETALAYWADENRKSAADFWSRSKVSIADPLLENLWYETFHARRCVSLRGKVPPGLFLPSTVQDYSHWHGDYHWNYNIQVPYWGDYTANHLDVGDAYFVAMDFALHTGRKIAKDYYGCRGAFIQLSTYPILAEDDTLGAVPMGRMAYMTGWAMTQYWWRYAYTLDKEWLRSTGYPVIRDCALFYTDFLQKRADGRYHIFPSNQGEDGFTGNAKEYTDRPQVMWHTRYCLRTAIRAAEALDVDADLRAAWRERLDHAAGDDGGAPQVFTGLEKVCYEANPPELSIGRPYRPQPDQAAPRPIEELGWYFGQYPMGATERLRNGDFQVERDLPAFRRMVEAWRRPNGIVWGMATANYGRDGAWTESLSAAAPLQEMMLQSWDGALRVFPAWPKKLDARFDSFRAEGAFLVSAAWSRGQVAELTVHSERGAVCRVYSPWSHGIRVADNTGREIAVGADPYGRPEFATQPGMQYRLQSW